MKYYVKYVDEPERREITYDKALDIALGSYRDNDMTRDMLNRPNRIMCRFSEITVISDDGMTILAGLYNQLPMDVEYDEDGNRVK